MIDTTDGTMNTVKYDLDDTFTVEMCNGGGVILRQIKHVCGRQVFKYLALDSTSWLALVNMKQCIADNIETIIRKQKLNVQYNIARRCCIKMCNMSHSIDLQYWLRCEHLRFRASITIMRLTFRQWEMLMQVQ